jgi:hypothetical protein
LCELCADVAAFRRCSAGRGTVAASVPSVPAARRRRAATVLVLTLVLAGCSELDDLDELTGAPPDPPESASGAVPSDAETKLKPEPGPEPDTYPDPPPPAAVPADPVPTPGPTAYPDDPGAPSCADADLELHLFGFDAALGTRFLSIEATNVSDRPCAVADRPAVRFDRASGTTTPRVTLTELCGGEPPRVVVPPGERVYAGLSWRAMSTALDPDVTVRIRVQAVPDGAEVALPLDEVPLYDGMMLDQIDVLDGAEVRVGWWQVTLHVFEGCLVPPDGWTAS